MTKASGVVKPLTGLRKYLSVKVKRFIDGYEEIMLKRFPSTYRMIQMFTTGMLINQNKLSFRIIIIVHSFRYQRFVQRRISVHEDIERPNIQSTCQ